MGRLFSLAASLLVTFTHSLIHPTRSQLLSLSAPELDSVKTKKNRLSSSLLRAHNLEVSEMSKTQTKPLSMLINGRVKHMMLKNLKKEMTT